MKECDRCGRDAEVETIQIASDWYHLCDGCIVDLRESIELYDWEDRYTEEQHERAISVLSDVDEINCVIGSYEDATIVVHTAYVSSDVVADVCDHFGLRIVAFYPRWDLDDTWPCVDDHGSIFEIVLEYTSHSPTPIPTSVIFEETHIENLDENDRQF